MVYAAAFAHGSGKAQMSRVSPFQRELRTPMRRLTLPLLASLILTSAASAETSAPVSSDQLLDDAKASVKDISTEELAALIEENPDVAVIDIRTLRETWLVNGEIDAPRHLSIPRGWLEFRIEAAVPDRDTPVVVYCGTNQRSPLAAETLARMGYTKVRNYAEGFGAWQEAGLPTASPAPAPTSMLYRLPEKVADGVWSAIGATAPPTYENSGHNNNLSFIVTDEGVVVINAGDNYLLARALHDEIKKVTDQPVRYVVLENGQGHAMLGSNYWKEQGAAIIAHADAAAEIEAHGAEILDRMLQGRRDKGSYTEVVMPDQTFDDEMILGLGGQRIEIRRLGPAHSPGDISVWLPEQKLIIAGDLAFHQRLLPVFEDTDTAGWIETWDAFEALGAEVVIPGHGDPTNMAEVTKYTKDYLVDLREQISEIIDAGGDLNQAYKIDQSAYRHLDTFDELARRTAGRVFRQMEFEF
jgi:glyoxylase-like metal-dependent hydrolase (beta-lactamase superfamily II)/rhodanese-related sulfurtransferase